MMIGVDVRHLEMGMGTGGAQILYHCLRALARYDRENEYVGYHKRIGQFGRSGGVRSTVAAVAADLISKNLFLPAWASHKDLDAIIHFLPPCSFTLRSIPQYAYILDVPERQETRTLRDRLYNDFFIGKTSGAATHILTISQFTADRLSEAYGVGSEKITVIYPCIDTDVFCPPQRPREGFILGVISKMCERKNPGAYIEVFSRLPKAFRRDHKLRIAGRAETLADFRPYVSDATLAEVEADVELLGVTDTARTAELYGTAGIVLFPSRYEGFGLPMVEAAACEADVVASDIEPFREAAAPSASLHPVDDWDGMARACEELINSREAFQDRAKESRKWGESFGYLRYVKALQSFLKTQ